MRQGVVTIRPAPPKTTLDRVRPTVVRRRVFEASAAPPTTPGFVDEYDGDESGPPSSVNVARALASLRGHELKRLDEILTRDDEAPPPPATPPEPAIEAVPTVRVGRSVALVELARLLRITKEELVTALVTHGFFDVTVKATLPRETARAAGVLFGWQIEAADEAPPSLRAKATKAKAKAKAKSPGPEKTVRVTKAKTKATKATPKARPAKLGPRRTSRKS